MADRLGPMTGIVVLVLVLTALICGSIVTRTPDEARPRQSRTHTTGPLFLRLRLLARVLVNGCRIVAAEHLECAKCRYGSICQGGYFTPKA